MAALLDGDPGRAGDRQVDRHVQPLLHCVWTARRFRRRRKSQTDDAVKTNTRTTLHGRWPQLPSHHRSDEPRPAASVTVTLLLVEFASHCLQPAPPSASRLASSLVATRPITQAPLLQAHDREAPPSICARMSLAARPPKHD